MFLGCDWIRVRFRHPLHHLNIRDIEFVSTGGTLVGAHFAFDDDARFLCQRLDCFEHFRSNSILGDNTLNDS